MVKRMDDRDRHAVGWRDSGIKTALNARNKFQLLSSSKVLDAP